jgi:class 3 adenylate cyclase
LEQANKNYGTRILVSSVVKAAVADYFSMRRMGKASLKGRKQPVEIFELCQEQLPLEPGSRHGDDKRYLS